MNKITWIFVLIAICANSCSDNRGDDTALITKNMAVNFGRAASSESIDNEAKIGDVHIVNYFNGERKKSVHVTASDKPITVEAVVGRSSVIYVVANINRYADAPLGANDFPRNETDLEAWLFEFNSSQIEAHKSNTTDPLFVMSGRSTEGEITDEDENIEMRIQLTRQFAKVDVDIWYDPSTMTKLDMTGAQVFFKQFVRGVAPFTSGGGMEYAADSDPQGEQIYKGVFTSIQGEATADKSKTYSYPRNYLPSNNATKKITATYLVVEAKWDGVTKYWMAPVSNALVDTPFRLVGNTYLSVTGKLVSEGEETPEITEKMQIELKLNVVDWHPYPLDDNEIGN